MDNLFNGFKIFLISWCIENNSRGRCWVSLSLALQVEKPRSTTTRHGMSLTPTFLDDSPDIIGMQSHGQESIDIVSPKDLAVVFGVVKHTMPSKEGDVAVLKR